MNVTIYHNPACDTSRKTLALIRVAATVVEYLKRLQRRQHRGGRGVGRGLSRRM
jgi:arsenate reductase